MKKRITMLLAVCLMLVWGLSVAAAEKAPEKEPEKMKVIFDTDNGIFGDDTKALFMMLNSGRFDLLGITTVIGNNWVEASTAYTLRHLELAGRTDIPVYMGMGEPLMGDHTPYLESGMLTGIVGGNVGYMAGPRPDSYLNLPEEPVIGYPKTKPQEGHAVDFIAEQVKKYPGEVTLICTGAGTNIAMTVKRYPEIVPLVKQVVYMGGAIDVPGNTTSAAEFNWWADPEAIKICLNSDFARQVIVPKDICAKARITYDTYEKIKAAPETYATKLFMEISGPNHENNPEYTNTLWDEVTVLYLLDSSFVTSSEERYLDIDTTMGMNYGRSIGYKTEPRRPDDFVIDPLAKKVEVLLDMDVEHFMDLYVKYFTMQPQP
ncbi:MAG: nucleoside hydrolase [Eubacteriales bacterium]|nr:nucleoside hydrolase [Eubacteriales bacterium]